MAQKRERWIPLLWLTHQEGCPAAIGPHAFLVVVQPGPVELREVAGVGWGDPFGEAPTPASDRPGKADPP